MGRDDSLFQKDTDRASADREEAIVFLASIIPGRNRMRIRAEIKNDKDFEVKHHLFLGMKVRNALRAGDFSYLPETMDFIWFSWLEKAVSLPEDEIILTDSIRERIRKYRISNGRAPLCSPLDPTEVQNVVRYLERRHSVELPESEVKYCDNITHAFCLYVPRPSAKASLREGEFDDVAISMLKSKGLTWSELGEIDPSKFTVFLPKRCYINYPARHYGRAWHELGHAAAHALDLKDKDFEESFALTCSFIGLLSEAKDGKFTFKKAFDEIESNIKSVRLLSRLRFNIPRPSLWWIQEYNPSLEFRDRDPDELLEELDKTITKIVDTDKEVYGIRQKRILARNEKPFLLFFGVVAAALLVISLILSLLHVV